MGRQLKRVPLDFYWPRNKVWKGYMNPYLPSECKTCDGTGLNKETLKLKWEWYGYHKTEWVSLGNGKRYNKFAWQYNLDEDDVQALYDEDRLWDFTRVPINEEQREIVKEKIKNGGNSWLPFDNGYKPTPEEVNEWAIHSLGHDSLNAHICIQAKAERLGVYGYCSVCDGDGVVFDSENHKLNYDRWEKYDPPEGEGYQLWENTSEGSPKSPVFETFDELCEWCAENATSFADFKASKEEWKEILNEGYVKKGNTIFL